MQCGILGWNPQKKGDGGKLGKFSEIWRVAAHGPALLSQFGTRPAATRGLSAREAATGTLVPPQSPRLSVNLKLFKSNTCLLKNVNASGELSYNRCKGMVRDGTHTHTHTLTLTHTRTTTSANAGEPPHLFGC